MAKILASVSAILSIVACVASGATITKIEPTLGSVNGQTRLTIEGTGFDERGRSNDIYIGESIQGVFCDPIPNECNPTRIVCLTEAFPARGPMPLSVRSHGFFADCLTSNGKCTFEYTIARTPEVYSIHPQWFTAPAMVTFTGTRFSQGDSTVGNFDFTTHLGSEERCILQDGHAVGATSFACLVESMRPGSLPVDIIMGAYGRASWSTSAAVYLFPTITGISPSSGSIAGGQRVTIKGTSFSTIANDNYITIHGSPCIVEDVQNDELTCYTTRHAATSLAAPSWQDGKVEMKYWTGMSGSSINKDFLGKADYLFPTGDVKVGRFQKYKSDGAVPICEWCAFEITSWFIAPEDGDYIFHAAGDDTFEFWLSENETPVARERQEIVGTTVDVLPYNERRISHGTYRSGTVSSKKMALKKGNKYWARAYLKESGGSDFFSLQVTLPNGTKITPGADYWTFREDYKPSVRVNVRGLDAMNGKECAAYGACNYDYTAAMTPTITGVSAEAQAGALVTVSGTAFDTATTKSTTTCSESTTCGGGGCACNNNALCSLFSECQWNTGTGKCDFKSAPACNTWSNNFVTINGVNCPVNDQTATQLVCVAPYVPGGVHEIQVHVEGKGRANGQAFTTVNPSITSITPTSGSVNGGNLLSITGSAFDPFSTITTVSVGGQSCLMKARSDYMLTCTVPAGTGSQTVTVNVASHSADILPRGYTYDENFMRPGTDFVDETVTIRPKAGSMKGGTEITIKLPNTVRIATRDQVSVTFGTSECDVTFAFGFELRCRTGSSPAATGYTGTVTFKDHNGIISTFVTPVFTYRASISYLNYDSISPLGGGRITVRMDMPVPKASDVTMKVAGVDCEYMSVSRDYVYCTAPKYNKNDVVALNTLDKFDFNGDGSAFTNKLFRTEYTDAVRSLTDGTVLIPAGSNYIMTKQQYRRPFVFTAKVKTLKDLSEGGSKVVMRACVSQNSLSSSGYRGIAGWSNKGTFAFARGGSVRQTSSVEYSEKYPGIGLDSSRFRNWKIEVWNRYIKYYIDDVLIYTDNDRGQGAAGSVGFGFSSTDIIVDDWEIKSLTNQNLQVNVSGTPLFNTYDVIWRQDRAPRVTKVQNTNVQAGNKITILGSNFRNYHPLRLAGLTSAKPNPSAPAAWISTSCSNVQHPVTENWMLVCTVSDSIPEGQYNLAVINRYGAGETYDTTAITIKAKISSISTTECKTGGARLTVSGAGFTSATKITVGGDACSILEWNKNSIVCDSPAKEAGTYNVRAIYGSNSEAACGACAIEYKGAPAVITSVSPTSGPRGTRVTIEGSDFGTSEPNFAWCQRNSRTSSKLICTVQSTTKGSEKVVLVQSDDSRSTGNFNFQVTEGATYTDVSKGAASSRIRLQGTINTAAGFTSVAKKTFGATYDDNAWTGGRNYITSCGNLKFWGKQWQGTTISRAFTGAQAHSFLRIAYKYVTEKPHLRIAVDGKYIAAERRYEAMPAKCEGKTLYTRENSIVIPHTGTDFSVALSTDNFGGFWGLVSYEISVASAAPVGATVGGVAATFERATNDYIQVAAPAAGSGTGVAVRATIGSATSCTTCTFDYDATGAPTVAGAVLGFTEGYVNDGMTPELAHNSRLQTTYSASGVQVKKVTGGSSWSASFYGPLALVKGDKAGVSFTAHNRGNAFIGLTNKVVGVQSSYQEVEYAIYLKSNGYLEYREFGHNYGQHSAYKNGDVFTIHYEAACDCVRYTKNGLIFYTSTRTPIWPIRPAASFHSVGMTVKNIKYTKKETVATRVVIVGAGFDGSSTTASLGTAVPCAETYATNGHFSCWTTAAVALNQALQVSASNKNGIVTNAPITVTASAAVPATATSSTNGAKIITAIGGPFTAPTITLNNGVGAAVITSTATNKVVFETPAVSAAKTAKVEFAQTAATTCVQSVGLYNTANAIGCTDVEFSADAVATISSVSPAALTTGTELVIKGTLFADEDSYVLFGSDRCVATMSTKTEFRCTVPAVEGGSYEPQIVSSVGKSNKGSAVTVAFTISALSSAATGTLGSATIVLTGTGFGTETTGATATVGGQALCSSITRADTTLTCVTNAGTFNGPIVVTLSSGASASSAAFGTTAQPTISSIAPIGGGNGAVITISGSNLGSGSATVGSAACTELSSTATAFVCQISGDLGAGNQAVAMTTTNGGVASGSANFAAQLYVTAISPKTGPAAGNQVVTISGSGFTSNSQAFVGGVKCTISAFTSGSITCTTGAMAEAKDHSVAVRNIDTTSPAPYNAATPYTYDASVTASITSITPNTGSAAGFELVTIDGTNFVDDILQYTITFGDARCDVQSATTTQVVCRTNAHATGEVNIMMNIGNSGIASNPSSAKFTYELQIDSVTPVGPFSLEGGVTVTLNGKGFIGFAKSSFLHQKFKLSVGYLPCEIQSATATTLTCVLAGSPRPYLGVQNLTDLLLSQSYTARPESDNSVQLVAEGISATVANTVNIQYRDAQTAKITAVTNVGEQSSGVNLVITGTGFAATGNEVTVGDATCAITAQSTTSISCTLTAGDIGENFVKVNVPNQGFAQTVTSCPAGQYLLCDGSCISDEECRYDEWGMYTCKDLMHLVVADTFCHSNGGTDRTANPFKTDAGRTFAINCPLYSCEGRDCNQTLFIGGRGGRVSTCGNDPNGKVVDYRAKVTAVDGKVGSVGGGRRVTITGTDFGTNLTWVTGYVGSTLCTPVSVTDTKVVCQTKAAAKAASGLTFTLFVQGKKAVCVGTACDGLSFADDSTPTATKISPSSPKAAQPVTITGTKFSTTVADNIVTIGGEACAVTSATATEIVCTAPVLTSAGTKGLVIRVIGFGSPAEYPKVTYTRRVDSVSISSGSTEGGTEIVVKGTAMKADATVIFGSDACKGTTKSYSNGALTVVTPACAAGQKAVKFMQGSSTSGNCGNNCRFNFADSKTPKITATPTVSGNSVTMSVGTLGSAVAGDVSIKAGDAVCTVSSFSLNSIVCTMESAHPAGTFPIVLNVAGLGNAKNEQDAATFTYALTVTSVTPTSGSRGGQQTVTIGGSGFGSSKAMSTVTVAGVACAVQTSTTTQITCLTGATATEETGPASVTVAHSAATAAVAPVASAATYAYQNAKTPIITSVSPSRGSTAGGTALTIGGSSLSNSLTVTIDGVACTQTSAQQTASTATILYCTTGAHATQFEAINIHAATAADGIAYNPSATYQYIDLWSRWTTWGNNPPPAFAESAVIGENHVVMVDYSPPRFHLIIVMGHMIFDNDVDIEFACTYIMVNYGRLTIGTKEKPYLKKATITLWGDRLTPEIPVHGAKVIALRHGIVEMHGQTRQPTWTLVADTINAGDSQIQLRGPIDWKVGEFIGIGSTDYDFYHNEKRMITAVSPADGQASVVTVTVEWPLQYTHFGRRQCFDTEKKVCVDEIAEVGLLTRNIKIQGDKNTYNLGFGGTLFLMPLGETQDRYARLDSVEFTAVGQQFIVGRYPVHYHVTGSSNNSYSVGCSVHFSLNRAFSIHGIQNNTYKDNVVYDTAGHSFFIEDGSEKYNVIDHNLVMRSRVSTSNLNTDVTPASYWIVSPLNQIINNHATGGQAYGFWISPFDPHSTGPTHSKDICPYTHKLWEFRNNVAHGNKKYGVNIFRYWFPKEVECDRSSADSVSIMRDITVYKNQIHGVTGGNQEAGTIGAVIYDNLISADNGWIHPDASAYWIEKNSAKNMTCGVQNSVLIATTNNDPFHNRGARRGINLPEGDNFFTDNVTFVNYKGNNHGFEPQAWAQRFSLCFPWGWDAVSRNLKWIESPNRVRFRFHHHGILNDEDGTLSGVHNSQLVPHAPMFDEVHCAKPAAEVGTLSSALVCPDTYKIRRFGISSMNMYWTDPVWYVEGSGIRRDEVVPEILRAYLVTAPINHEIEIDFKWWRVPQTWDWKYGGKRMMQPGERALFKVWYNSTRHHVYAKFGGMSLNKTWNAPFPTLDTPKSSYAFDNETMLFKGLMTYENSGMSVSAYDCPDEGCPLPPTVPFGQWDKVCTSFNSPDTWLEKKVPKPNANLYVKFEESVCLQPDPIMQAPANNRQGSQCSAGSVYEFRFNALRIEGILRFHNHHCPCEGANVNIYVETNVWIRQGSFEIGNSTDPITRCTVRVIMGQLPFLDSSRIGGYKLPPFGFRGLNLESGRLMLNGQVPQPLWTRLTQVASAGSKTLVVAATPDWKAGDAIVIAGTSRSPMFTKSTSRVDESEHRIIESVNGNVITLAKALEFSHHGEQTTSINNKEYNIGAEVAILTRTVGVTGGHNPDELPNEYYNGWRLNVGCTEENYEGCSSPEDPDKPGWPMDNKIKPGLLLVNSVMLQDVGQGGERHGGVDIDGLRDPYGTMSKGALFSNNAIWRSFNTALNIKSSTTGFKAQNNVIYNVYGDGIRVASSGNTLEGNLVIRSTHPEPNCDFTHFIFWDCRIAHFRVVQGNTLTNNIAASGAGAGYLTMGDTCDNTFAWSGNVAHSMREGLLIADNPGDDWYLLKPNKYPSSCKKFGGLLTYWSGDYGIAAWYAKGSFEVVNYESVDNQIGMMLMSYSSGIVQNTAPTMKSSNMMFAGKWPGHACSGLSFKCRGTLLDSAPWCNFFLRSTGHPMGNVGIMETLFTSNAFGPGKTKGEQKFMWMEMDSYATMTGQASHSNVHFDNWDGEDACGLKNVAFHQNIYSNDTFHQHTFEGVTWGDNIKNGGEFWARTTYGHVKHHPSISPGGKREETWYLDFDNSAFGAYWADSPNKIWITDKDGSFTRSGVAGSSIIASQTITRPTQFKDMRYDGRAFDTSRGGLLPAARDGCVYNEGWNAFQCDGQKFKWVTIGLESFADDRLTRRAAPVVLCKGDGMIEVNGDPLCQGGVVDYASGPVMKGKAQRATLDRMSRWRFIAEDSGNYTLSFRGQPPTWIRASLQNHEYLNQGDNVGVTLNLRYFGLNAKCRVGVYVDGVRQRPGFGFGYPWEMTPPQTWPGPRDNQGTHFHDKYVNSQIVSSTGAFGYERNVMYFSLRPGSLLDLKQEPIIQINADVAMPLDAFFAEKDTFVAAMASVLGIDESRIRFTDIQPGTTRRRQSGASNTKAELVLDMNADEAQAAVAAGPNQRTYNDMGSNKNKLDAIAADPSQGIGKFQLNSLSATLVEVQYERPEIKVADGTPYISMNVTKHPTFEQFNTTAFIGMANSWLNRTLGGSPYNDTFDATYFSGVFTDNTNWTQFAMVLAYEDLGHGKTGLEAMMANFQQAMLQDPAISEVFPGWKIRDVKYDLNGWTDGAPTDFESNTNLVIFVVASLIGVILVVLVGGALIYYFVRVRPRKVKVAKKKKDLAVCPTSPRENPADVMFSPGNSWEAQQRKGSPNEPVEEEHYYPH